RPSDEHPLRHLDPPATILCVPILVARRYNGSALLCGRRSKRGGSRSTSLPVSRTATLRIETAAAVVARFVGLTRWRGSSPSSHSRADGAAVRGTPCGQAKETLRLEVGA